MDPLFTFIIAVGLAMDAFTICLGVGTSGKAGHVRPVFRLFFHMGLFQGLMAFLGWLAGSSIARWISALDHWIALILLAYIGINMIRSGLNVNGETYCDDPSRGRTMLMLCVACSIDALAVGLSLAMLQADIMTASLVIAAVTWAFSLVGLLAGHRLGHHFGKRMEILGGLLLNGIGLRILITHII